VKFRGKNFGIHLSFHGNVLENGRFFNGYMNMEGNIIGMKKSNERRKIKLKRIRFITLL
jgi:hypothetical protein